MEKKADIARNDFFSGKLPDLQQAEAAPLELNGEYWSPEKEGESRRMFFKELRQETVIDPVSGKDAELIVAYFVQVVDGNKRIVRQAGRRLTGVLESLQDRITEGTPFEITYLGKKKNKTNSFMSDNWSIKPLFVR